MGFLGTDGGRWFFEFFQILEIICGFLKDGLMGSFGILFNS
jgi:hypothetical protein